jgi:hypothetical protein
MTTVPGTPGEPGNRVRIAISSPEILAHIRHEFASKGLEVRIDGLPAVDVVVTPAGRPVDTGLVEVSVQLRIER